MSLLSWALVGGIAGQFDRLLACNTAIEPAGVPDAAPPRRRALTPGPTGWDRPHDAAIWPRWTVVPADSWPGPSPSASTPQSHRPIRWNSAADYSTSRHILPPHRGSAGGFANSARNRSGTRVGPTRNTSRTTHSASRRRYWLPVHNWMNGRHRIERHAIAAAQALGDRREVFRLVSDGEFR